MKKTISCILLITAFLLLLACTKTSEEKYSHSLQIDRKIVFEGSESSGGKKFGKMFEDHKDLKIAIEKACLFSDFLAEKSAKSATTGSAKSVVTGSEKSVLTGNESVIEEKTAVKIKKYFDPNHVIVCTSGRGNTGISGCQLILGSSNQVVQEQYLLDLLKLLKVNYRMVESALFTQTSLDIQEKNRTTSEELVVVSSEELRCQRKLTFIN